MMSIWGKGGGSFVAVAKTNACTHCGYPQRDGRAELAWVARSNYNMVYLRNGHWSQYLPGQLSLSSFRGWYMSSELQLDVRCLSWCGGDIWWTLTKERQARCYLQVKLCDPCLSSLSVTSRPKKRYINTLPFLSFLYCGRHTVTSLMNLTLLPLRQSATNVNISRSSSAEWRVSTETKWDWKQSAWWPRSVHRHLSLRISPQDSVGEQRNEDVQ